MVEQNVREQELATILMDVERLLLDPENPRLTAEDKKWTQAALLREMVRDFDLGDLVFSLAENGYFSEEPLIVVMAEKNSKRENGSFYVVEGNRRLAAIKLLLSEEAREEAGAKNIPELAPEVAAKLNPLPIKIYESRKVVIPYLGVRHILGVKPWDSLAKARYIDSLLKQGYDFQEVIRMVAGRRTDVIRRWLLTLYAIRQANEITDQQWDEAERSFSFSFLYTALGYASVRQFLGLDSSSFKSPKPNPIKENHYPAILEHMTHLYGSSDGKIPPVLRDSRRLRELAAVYESKPALETLRGGSTLEEAYRKSGGEEAALVDLVREANRLLEVANGIAFYHKGHEEALRYTKRCSEAADNIVRALQG